MWREGWRNLHGEGPVRLELRARIDGQAEPLTVARTWPPDAELDGAGPREVSATSWEALGWEAALARFRPILSYNELGTMFSERAAELFDALAGVLALEDFEALGETLRQARLARGRHGTQESKARRAVRDAAGALDDPRAHALALALNRRPPDLAAAADALTGEAAPPQEGEGDLRPLAALAVPLEVEVLAAFETLDASVTALRDLEQGDAERDEALADLLARAHAFHERHAPGDATCPVCGTADVLDGSWSLRVQADVEHLRARSRELTEARQTAEQAARAASGLFDDATPRALAAAADAGLDVEEARDAWDTWTAALAQRRPERAAALDLARASAAAVASARAQLEQREDVWRPLREQGLAWLAVARAAADEKQAVATLTAAEDWVKQLVAELRRERLAPVVDAARRNWERLRHESNVSLGGVALQQSGARRSAVFDVAVDGADASAFGVMSQGELSALAISVFLPRAALPDSPFGFMVIDDPVQSMDPAKVDGLARVLADAARERQVIVFSHDARLGEAVRRLNIDARHVRVQRRARSKVEVVVNDPPSDRYVGEAFAIAKTEQLSEELRGRTVPGICRTAIEAACASRIRKREIEAGTPHADVDRRLEEQGKTIARLADALGLPVQQGNEIYAEVERLAGSDAVWAVKLAHRRAQAPVARAGRPRRQGHPPPRAGPRAVTVNELLIESRRMLDESSPVTAGAWPRAAALLLRQPLEQTLDVLWAQRVPGADRLPMRAQLLLLRDQPLDPTLAADATSAHDVLSRAIHFHPFELEPTREELRWLAEAVERVARGVELCAEARRSLGPPPDQGYFRSARGASRSAAAC